MNKKYEVQIFNSRNTYSVSELTNSDSLESARAKGRILSMKTGFPVVICKNDGNLRGAFEKYEAGEKTEWSLEPLT